MNHLPRIVQYLQSGRKPYLILASMLILTYAVLAARGFALGFYGDVVAYQFHYRFDGVIGGMNWLIAEHWQRHLLGALFSAPLHILTPNRYDLWYALELGLHFSLGMVIFLLVDTLQSGQRRWLAFAVACFFVFDTLQIPPNIEFATSSHSKASLILAALSLYSYIRFVRSRRQRPGWYMLNTAAFLLAVMIYEHSFFFFVLHPVIAFAEDRRQGQFRLNRRCLWPPIRDSLLHVLITAIVVYLLLALFRGNDNLQLTPAYLLGQIADGLVLLLSPVEMIERLALAASMSQTWVLALLAALTALFFGGWIWHTPDETSTASWPPLSIMLFGLLLILLNLLNTAPTIWPFANSPRLLYASSIGSGMVWVGLLASAVNVHRRFGGMVFALMMAILLAPGISFLYEHQAVHLARDQASSRTFQAIFDAIPEFADESKPYLLLITDRHAEAELALHPRDVNFPHVFGLRYGIREFRADAVLFNDDESQKIQQIQLREAGIVSPLSPGEVISYHCLVIVSYDSAINQAEILDRLPDDALLRGNFEIHADRPLQTNWALLPSYTADRAAASRPASAPVIPDC